MFGDLKMEFQKKKWGCVCVFGFCVSCFGYIQLKWFGLSRVQFLSISRLFRFYLDSAHPYPTSYADMEAQFVYSLLWLPGAECCWLWCFLFGTDIGYYSLILFYPRVFWSGLWMVCQTLVQGHVTPFESRSNKSKHHFLFNCNIVHIYVYLYLLPSYLLLALSYLTHILVEPTGSKL